jgi:hypothetical protein
LFIGIRLCCYCTYGYIAHFEIGFVWVWFSYCVLRIAYCVERLALFGFVFWGGAERNIGVNLWGKRGCVGFVAVRIGFVLHN